MPSPGRARLLPLLLIPIYYLANVSAATAKLQGLFNDTAGYYWLYDAWLKS